MTFGGTGARVAACARRCGATCDSRRKPTIATNKTLAHMVTSYNSHKRQQEKQGREGKKKEASLGVEEDEKEDGVDTRIFGKDHPWNSPSQFQQSHNLGDLWRCWDSKRLEGTR